MIGLCHVFAVIGENNSQFIWISRLDGLSLGKIKFKDMNFPKLDRVCCADDYRQQFQFVKVEKDFTYATDAHIIVRHRTPELFPDYFLESLPEEGVLIHMKIIKNIREKRTTKVTLTDDKKMIELMRSDGLNLFFKLPALSDYNFPQKINELFPQQSETTPLSVIAFNAGFLYKLSDGMAVTSNIVRLFLYDPTKAILVLPNGEGDFFGAIGLIMPVMLQ